MTPAAPLALSQRQAARLLGVGRDTVRALVRAGRLREVPWGRAQRIPLAEVQRLAVQGFTLGDAKPIRTPRRRPRAGTVDPDALRALDLGSL